MKTVSGKVVSCQQISLSRAAKHISRFTASDNEASPAFAAYLRRTSAAFNELVQLHKEYKISLGESKLKKDNSSGIVTHGTANSVGKGKGKKGDEVNVDEHSRNVHSASVGIGSEVHNGGRIPPGDVPDVDDGLKKSKKHNQRHGGKHGSDHIEVHDVKNEIEGLGASEEVKSDVPDVGGTATKSKKKRGNDVSVPSIENDQSHDAIDPNEVEKKTGSLDASEDLKKEKKNKRDKRHKENHSGATENLKEVQLHPHREGDDTGEAADTVQNNGDEQKKHKKKSKLKDVKESSNLRSSEQKERESSSIRSDEQIREMNLENKVEVIGEKKTRSEAEGRENGHNMETEAAGKKESRKRKHERLAGEELVGSPEAVRSKKKKI